LVIQAVPYLIRIALGGRKGVQAHSSRRCLPRSLTNRHINLSVDLLVAKAPDPYWQRLIGCLESAAKLPKPLRRDAATVNTNRF
jgi:hypothetical protein